MGWQQIAGTATGKTAIYQSFKNIRLVLPSAEAFMGLIILVAALGTVRLLQVSFTDKLVSAECPQANATYLGYVADNLAYVYEVEVQLTYAIERVPTCANLYRSLGDVQAWLGKRTQALDSYQHYLQLAGDHTDPAVVKTVQLLEKSPNGNPLTESIVP